MYAENGDAFGEGRSLIISPVVSNARSARTRRLFRPTRGERAMRAESNKGRHRIAAVYEDGQTPGGFGWRYQ